MGSAGQLSSYGFKFDMIVQATGIDYGIFDLSTLHKIDMIFCMFSLLASTS